jgi:hypothetical protein
MRNGAVCRGRQLQPNGRICRSCSAGFTVSPDNAPAGTAAPKRSSCACPPKEDDLMAQPSGCAAPLGWLPPRPSAVCATGEPAPCLCGRFRQRQRCGVPWSSSSIVSRAPSPIDWTRRQRSSPRQASRGQAVLNPAATNFRHSSSTGAYPRARRPSGSQRFEPTSVARIGACVDRCWRLASAMTRHPSWSRPEAPSAATAPGLSVGFMAYFLIVPWQQASAYEPRRHRLYG